MAMYQWSKSRLSVMLFTEILGPGVIAWAEEMLNLRGNEVQLYCEKDAPHDTVSKFRIQFIEIVQCRFQKALYEAIISLCFCDFQDTFKDTIPL